MTRAGRPSNQLATARPEATVEVRTSGDIALLTVSGLVDERFRGFGTIAALTVVIDVSRITRMTSFGVRQWLKAMDALPKGMSEFLLLGCPTFFVDQLNMVLNFGGASKVLTVIAPYTCPSCGAESGEPIDVLVERANLASGSLPDKECTRCGGKLEFDETPESYFSFVSKYGAAGIQPATAELLETLGLYAAHDTSVQKPPKIIKLVHGSVTYFRIIGRVGGLFRARPFLVGAEGEIVIDLAEVDRFEPTGDKEWRRLLKNLTAQVPAVTLIDVKPAILAAASDSLSSAGNLAVASLLMPFVCAVCGRRSHQTQSLLDMKWPPKFIGAVCQCGGPTRHDSAPATIGLLKNLNTNAPEASAHLIAQRDQLLASALSDANAAQPTENASPAVAASDAILGKYKIVRRLSSGGLVEVFLAKQVGIGGFEKPVVLKKLQRNLPDGSGIEPLLDEVRLAGHLTHPNIVQLLDVGQVGGAMYLAMEHVHGKNLRDIIERVQATTTSMPTAEACYIVREVAQALDHAYWSTNASGQLLSIIHGDVSPHNVMVSYDGAVKVLDFGVARSVRERADLQYMAPEGQVDHRSDLFSLGVMLYELCSGSRPFQAGPKEIVKKIRAGKYQPLQEVAIVPDTVAALVARLLSANPDDRPRRGHELVAELTVITRGSALSKFVSQLFPDEQQTDIAHARTDRQSVPIPNEAIAVARTRSARGLAIDASVSIFAEDRDPTVPDEPKRMQLARARTVAADVKPGPTTARSVLIPLLIILVIALGATALYLFDATSWGG